jgi:acyl dehydratase
MTTCEPDPGTPAVPVRVGHELENQVHVISKLQLLEYTIVSRDPNLIHHDPDHARAAGLPDVIVQGTLKGGLLARFAEERLGGHWRISEFAVRYRGADVVGTPLTAKGKIVAVDPSGGSVDLELWLETASGDRNTSATAKFTAIR